MDESELAAAIGIATPCCGRDHGAPRGKPEVRPAKLLGAATGSVDYAGPPSPPASPTVPARMNIWQIDEKMQCSVLGTCLPLGEFIAIAQRMGYKLNPQSSSYEVHAWAVDQMASPTELAKRVDKAIEKRHGAIAQKVRAARSEAEVEARWQQVHGEGRIAGAYWGAMTHPMCGRDLRWRLFGEIHMLGHLIGASRREDLLRLHTLEIASAEQSVKQRLLASEHSSLLKKNKRLTSELATQQRRTVQLEQELAEARECFTASGLRTDSREHEARIAELEHLLVEARRERTTADSCSTELRAQLSRALADSAHLREQLDEVSAENRALELEMTQSGIEPREEESTLENCALRGMRLLYLGGRTHLVPYYRSLVEERGGVLLHHDGGLEQSLETASRLFCNVDAVICPVDCISHGACLLAKQACRNLGKLFIPLRSSGLSSLARALRGMRLDEGGAAAQPG